MKCKIVTKVEQKGNNKITGKPFDYWIIGGLIETARGTEFAEFGYDKDAPAVECDKWYDMDVVFYPDQKKKLSLRVERLRAVSAAPLKAAG